MKTKPKPKPPKSHKASGRLYTFTVMCSFNIEYTFNESEVEQDPGGDVGEFQPTDKALRNLEKDLNKVIGQHYPVTQLSADAESDQFLGC